MSYWVEIHCDVDRAARSGTDRDNILLCVCHSDRNETPAAMGHTASSAAKAAARSAREVKWKRDRDGYWTCPGCQKHGLKADA